MIKIDFLKNHPETISALSHIWHETLGKIWMPEIELEEIRAGYYNELDQDQDMPLTYVALQGKIPVGSCTLLIDDCIRPDLGPWLGDLVVDKKYQKQGIGKMLLSATLDKAKELGFETLYLFAFEAKIVEYYKRLGWKKIGTDKFKSHIVTIMDIDL